MFKKLFKPKWQSAKPQVRIQAVSQLDAADIDDLHIIELLAKNDVEADVRLAAVHKLKDREKLIAIIQQEKNPAVRTSMIEHLMPFMETDASLDTRIEKLIKNLDSQALAAIVESTKSAALGSLALESISDENVLKSYALKLPLAALRQRAAEKISDESLLEELEKATKGKDKGVFRIARNKLQAIRDELKKEENLEQQIETICLNMEQLARGSDDPMHQTKVDHWHKQWTRIEMHAASDDAKRFNRAYDICRQMVNEAQQEENAIKEQAQQQREALQERMGACEQLENTLAQLKASDSLQSEDVPALSALLKTQQTRWEEAAEESTPDTDERKRFNRAFTALDKTLSSLHLLNEHGDAMKKVALALLEAEDATTAELLNLKKKLDKATRSLDWPEEVAAPEAYQLVQKANRMFEHLRAKAEEKEREAVGNLKQLLEKLDTAINEGRLKPANKLLGDAQKWARHIPMKKAQDYQKELRVFAARVNELRDWQGFAVVPKKESLVAEMESLVAMAMDPQERANRIKRLQKEWKDLGPSREGQELWQRFSEAAEKAYEPCKEYFENLSEIRQKNLESRKQIVSQLEDYLQHFNFNDADWAAVNQVYETAKQEWRLYNPVERKEGKSVQDHFNKLLDRLRDKLSDEWNRNRKHREDLIEKAQALIEEPDLNKAIEEAKTLQRQWKDTGMVARRDENKLWRRFRGNCDKIFARRDQERQAASEEREKNLTEANHVIELIEHLSEADNLSLEQSQKEFRELQKRFSDLGPMPREQYEDVQKRYKGVCEQFQDGIKLARAAARKAGVAKVWQEIARLDELEAKCIQQDQLDLLGNELSLELENDPLAGGLQQRYESLQKLAEGGSKPQDDQLKQNADQLRSLCIELEIAAGVESPGEDQQQRMELQVSRLSTGLGQREQRQGISEKVIQLQQKWCEVGPAEPQQRSRYTQRFVDVLKQIGEL